MRRVFQSPADFESALCTNSEIRKRQQASFYAGRISTTLPNAASDNKVMQVSSINECIMEGHKGSNVAFAQLLAFKTDQLHGPSRPSTKTTLPLPTFAHSAYKIKVWGL